MHFVWMCIDFALIGLCMLYGFVWILDLFMYLQGFVWICVCIYMDVYGFVYVFCFDVYGFCMDLFMYAVSMCMDFVWICLCILSGFVYVFCITNTKYAFMNSVRVNPRPGMDGVTLGEKCNIMSNVAGFFNTEVYASGFLSKGVREHVLKAEMPKAAGKKFCGIMSDDAAGHHAGETEEKGGLLPGKLNATTYLATKLCQFKFDIPGGLTSKRPQDQKYINFLVVWKYLHYLEEITGMADFRNGIENVEPHHVCTAFVLALEWLREHPECIVAAWLESGLVTPEDYKAEGYHDLLAQAEDIRSGRNRQVEDALAHESGLWPTEAVMLTSVAADLETAMQSKPKAKVGIEYLDDAPLPSSALLPPPEAHHLGKPINKPKQCAKRLVVEAKAAMEAERVAKKKKADAKQEQATHLAAAEEMKAVISKLRVPRKGCLAKCNGDFHVASCPNHHANKSLAQQTLEQRGRIVAQSLTHAYGSDDALKFTKALGLPAPNVKAHPSVVPLPADILGGRASSCPAGVHERMLLLAMRNEISQTTPFTRSGHRRAPIIFENLPTKLQDAAKWGYIHPCLAVPGHEWKFLGEGRWELNIC